MRFAIYRGQTLSAVVESETGKIPAEIFAKQLQEINGASSVVPIESDEHEAVLTSNAATATTTLGGYPYRGITLSTSPVAQTRWTALYAARDAVTYPLIVFSADDSASIEIKDSAEVAAVFLGMVCAMTAAHQAGARAKAKVEAASAEVKR